MSEKEELREVLASALRRFGGRDVLGSRDGKIDEFIGELGVNDYVIVTADQDAAAVLAGTMVDAMIEALSMVDVIYLRDKRDGSMRVYKLAETVKGCVLLDADEPKVAA